MERSELNKMVTISAEKELNVGFHKKKKQTKILVDTRGLIKREVSEEDTGWCIHGQIRMREIATKGSG